MTAKSIKRCKPQPLKPKTKLTYLPDRVPGFGRIKRGRGIFYIDRLGNRVTDEKKLKRFRALAIPPAWKEVWISPSRKGHLQATGIDEQGRKQYVYHPEWTVERQQEKIQRMLAFGKVLPAIRQQMAKDMRRKSLVKEKAVAIALNVMEETLIRVGNERYLQKYSSHGLTTLKKKHIGISQNTIEFCFRGKKNVRQEIQLRNARLAAKLVEMQKLPGPFFFQYMDGAGHRYRLHARDINGYLQQHTDMEFSSKDYRTWYAALWTFCLLAKCPEYTDEKMCKANIIRVLDAVSERLGNTRSVCKQYYVPDSLLSAYEDGSLAPYLIKYQQNNRKQTAKQAEMQLLAFLSDLFSAKGSPQEV